MNSQTPADARTGQASRSVEVRGLVIAAAQGLAPQYPLHRFIARNPYAGYEDLPWDIARERIAQEHGVDLAWPESTYRELYSSGRINAADLVESLELMVHDASMADIVEWNGRPISVRDVLLADVLAAPPAPPSTRLLYTPAERFAPRTHAKINDQLGRDLAGALGHAPIGRPGNGERFWDSWRRLSRWNLTLPRRVRRGIVSSATYGAEEAIAVAFERWGVAGDDASAFLRAHLLALPGWAAAIADGSAAQVTTLDYLAARVTLERLWLPSNAAGWSAFGPGAPSGAVDPVRHRARVAAAEAELGLTLTASERAVLGRILLTLPESIRTEVWHGAFERHAALKITPRSRPEARPTGRPSAQVVMCIDPRSEGMRRNLEHDTGIETYGFAGFFALAISFRDAAGNAPVASCPALVSPRASVREGTADHGALRRYRSGLEAGDAADRVIESVSESAASPFAYAELAGWAAGPALLARTLAPLATANAANAVRRGIAPRPATRLDPDVAFALDERVAYAESALRMMGLVAGFARIILLCGHGATVTNNPFAAALQCGACGGHEGAPNARAAAAIFNDPSTRDALTTRGIPIPPDTVFVAAQHDTVTDRVVVLEPWAVPASHAGDLARLQSALLDARSRNARERLAELPGTREGVDSAEAVLRVERRSADWAQVYPEWGLCGNLAMIIAPRTVTAGRNLKRRVFLHSYEAGADPDGSALETILTAPMVVAQWINAQYAASTLAPNRFGAGSKAVHNIVGDIGVLSGYGGDLRSGLPWQSVALGREWRHEPIRLQVFVQAPLDRVGRIVSRSHVVRQLVENRWITLRARADDNADWAALTRYGWQPTASRDTAQPAFIPKEKAN